MDRPPAVEIAVWLNQFRRGQLSASDATNALEFLTESLTYNQDDADKSWQNLVLDLPKLDTPFFAVLPMPGRTFGLTSDLLSSIDASQGVVILGKNLILAARRREDGWSSIWSLIEIQNQPEFLDAGSTRRSFLELLEKSAKLLSSLDLQADRKSIDAELEKLRPIYLPPLVNRKTLADLDLATRIWVIADHGLVAANSFESPSKDRMRIDALSNLKSSALELMAATSTVA